MIVDAEDPNILTKLKDDLSEVVRHNVTSDPSKVPEVTASLKKFYLNTLNGTLNNYWKSKLIDVS